MTENTNKQEEIPIIGVIGGTFDNGSNILDLARHVGKQIAVAQEKCILLTGAEATADPNRINANVMDAFLGTAPSNKRIGAIGIIPNNSSQPNLPSVDPLFTAAVNPNCRFLYYRTGVVSHVRNVLNGQLPDVVIALPGENGTLSEIAYALHCSTPLVFLQSWNELKVIFQGNRNEVSKIISKLREPADYNPASIVNKLSDLFNGDLTEINYAVISGDISAKSDRKKLASVAVNVALEISKLSQKSNNYYPNLTRGHILLQCMADYFTELQKLKAHL